MNSSYGFYEQMFSHLLPTYPKPKEDWNWTRLAVVEARLRTYSNHRLHECATGYVFLADNARRRGSVWSAMVSIQTATLCRLELKRRGWKLPG